MFTFNYELNLTTKPDCLIGSFFDPCLLLRSQWLIDQDKYLRHFRSCAASPLPVPLYGSCCKPEVSTAGVILGRPVEGDVLNFVVD